ncbi:tRNA (guanosine(46)-N7)-methyltransferase TrmB [Mycoplasma putrefaciens]|uniref:tRNA (guanine-N(7)-)-methyltransferase n=1 Tax=Mycoplasma putrefaciens (strain ATCC 15718 / NCTC 10155 / C30 KS-1 / KS-1) TaxID=743965 RepID=A0A7U3ZT44_MYCPK|nr:tRNA (guanosine(46)-N7)-methyltransferase TrmB [Mycoplasma putrefaciens]AEM68994.1 tRNA (guanine-N(7)-)-methyltransferase [Mycoplasma putrefaciens KS1]
MRLRNKPWTKDFLEKHKQYLIHFDKQNQIDLVKVFNNQNPVHLEIGCGKGQFITTLSLKNSNINYIAIEKETTIVGVALKKSLEQYQNKQMNNLKYFNDFADDLTKMFAKDSISKIYLNFSDPWPKKRHAKKRLTFISFLNNYSKILKKGGLLEFKSDNDQLYQFSLEQLSLTDKWEIVSKTNDLYKDKKLLEDNVASEYENKFHKQNKNINKLIIKNLK